jgi:Flp pilus assembly protein TadG
MSGRTNTQRGSIMITTAVSLFVLVGMLGLSLDLGRVYIAKHEAQAFADIAAVAAAKHLNGLQSGIDAATSEVTGGGANSSVNNNLWNFSTTKFGSNGTTSPAPTVEFATAIGGPWSAAPATPLTNYAFVRVTATPTVNLAFLPAVGTALSQQVSGRAVGGVVVEPSPGYLPYTPFAHNAMTDATGKLLDPNFGFTVGQEYAIRWPGNLNKNNACAGDKVSWPMYNFSSNSLLPGSDRGYFQLQSAASIAAAILGGATTIDPQVGDWINLTNGNKQSEASAMTTRAGQDTDQTNYQPTPGTAPAYYGNDMRLVILPVNDPNVVSGQVKVIGFGAFLLYPSYAGGGGNQPWCAIYMGSRTQGGGGGVCSNGTCVGSFVVRLVQ